MEKRHIGPKPGKEGEGEGKGKEVEGEGVTLDLLREVSRQLGSISSAEMASRRAPGWETPRRMQASEGRDGESASETTREEIAFPRPENNVTRDIYGFSEVYDDPIRMRYSELQGPGVSGKEPFEAKEQLSMGRNGPARTVWSHLYSGESTQSQTDLKNEPSVTRRPSEQSSSTRLEKGDQKPKLEQEEIAFLRELSVQLMVNEPSSSVDKTRAEYWTFVHRKNAKTMLLAINKASEIGIDIEKLIIGRERNDNGIALIMVNKARCYVSNEQAVEIDEYLEISKMRTSEEKIIKAIDSELREGRYADGLIKFESGEEDNIVKIIMHNETYYVSRVQAWRIDVYIKNSKPEAKDNPSGSSAIPGDSAGSDK